MIRISPSPSYEKPFGIVPVAVMGIEKVCLHRHSIIAAKTKNPDSRRGSF